MTIQTATDIQQQGLTPMRTEPIDAFFGPLAANHQHP
jgi:hypothetical protein